MNSLSELFGRNMTLVFFVYGLAWFSMGLAIVLAIQRSLGLLLTSSLVWLAAFGFVHGFVEWLDMFQLLPEELVPAMAHPHFSTVKLSLQALSVFFLVIFSVSLLSKLSSHGPRLRWVPVALLVLWMASPVYAPLFEVRPDTSNGLPIADQAANAPLAVVRSAATISGDSCVYCHHSVPDWPAQPAVPAAVPPRAVLEIASRYLFYLPGLLLGAVGFCWQARTFRRQGLSAVARDCYGVAAAFVVNGLVAGVVVAPAPYFPAVWINYHTFFSFVGMPPQVFRALAAVVISLLILRILRVYRIEQDRQLETAREERLRVEEQLSKLRVQTAVVEERERIGREIHDGLAQSLAGLHILSSVARKYLARGQRARAEVVLQDIEQLVDSAYGDAREAITSLRVSTYGGSGLVGLLQEYVSRFDEQSGLSTALVVGDGWRAGCTSQAAETQTIRIVQEALSNVRKHASARRVTVELNVRESEAEVVVQDDGRGFEPARYTEANDGRHFGLRTMHERALMVGGSLEVDSAPGRGTRVVLRVPLEAPDRTEPAGRSSSEIGRP